MQRSPAQVILRIVARCALLVLAISLLQAMGPALHMRWWHRISATLMVAAIACELRPSYRFGIAGGLGLAVLTQWRPTYAPYAVVLICVLYALSSRPRWFTVALVTGTIVVPKELFRRLYHQPLWHDWVADYLLAHTLLVGLLWLRERSRIPEIAARPTFGRWLTMFAFPTQPMNPLNLGPGELWVPRSLDLRAIGGSLALVAIKGVALTLLARFGPPLLMTQTAESLAASSWATLWSMVIAGYLATALTLSGTGDVVVAIARVLGWRLDHPFRWALLAWNPVELWRRWGIYNRKLLLKLVYFPLGGNRRHRLLNVMATFLASALVLHTGWIGSKYWEVGASGWRDQTVYFAMQGLAVCACLGLWRLRGKQATDDRALRLSTGRVAATVLTQATSAWMHVMVLTPNVAWAGKWRVMARCLGL